MPRVSRSAISALEVVESSPDTVEVIRRVRPPADLTDEQRVEFSRVISEMPADWFSVGNVAMLAQYCRHVVTARRVSGLIEAAISSGDDEGLDKLLRAQVSESRILNQLMTSLRMTPQAVAPPVVSRKRLQTTESPWSGFGKKRA